MNTMNFENFIKKLYKGKKQNFKKMETNAKKLTLMSEVISFLVQKRKEKKLTQTEIAKRMGVKPCFISRVERGDIDFRLSTLMNYLNNLK